MKTVRALFVAAAAAAALALPGIVAPARADLVSADWHTAGDGLLTYDTASGLYWLDWTVATNVSRNAMADMLATPGSAFYGMRYATAAELAAMCASAGAPDVGGRTAANIPAVTSMLSTLGANDLFDFLGAGNSSAAFLADADQFNAGWYLVGILTIETFDNPVTAKAGELGSGNGATAFGVGHALVSTVPAPGAAALLALGGLAAGRRRR